MNKNLKVVLADTDALYLQKLKRCLERKGDITIVGMSDTGCEAIELVQMHQADMLITDIILRESDGFWAMKALRKLESECMCIVISALDNDKVVREATSLGAEYYMAKPIQGDLLLERIYHLAEMDHMELPAFIRAMPEEVFHHKEVDTLSLEAEISGVLSRMGISASIKGYHFIRRAIMMAVEDSEVLIGITKGLYPDWQRATKPLPARWKEQSDMQLKVLGKRMAHRFISNWQDICSMINQRMVNLSLSWRSILDWVGQKARDRHNIIISIKKDFLNLKSLFLMTKSELTE